MGFDGYRPGHGLRTSRREVRRMVKLYVPLRPQEIDQLVALARQERRLPAQQAAYIIARVLSTNEPPPAGQHEPPAIVGS